MPNGKPGDHPLTDLLVHGLHPFPTDIEQLLRELHRRKPELLQTDPDSDLFKWERGEALEVGRQYLQALLDTDRP